ncbi:MAG TPA: sterol desaturase family protein [Stellaceae bacterium]|jgi:sterol desaturase/sphingolipid hydroxylase (fatty acid hydroxylase superfamily)|nr:sterol desaturase family protein [Stellaceae bacterium]
MQDAVAHLLAWKGMAVLLWLAVVFVAERLAPAAPFPIKAVRPGARLLGNATLWMINAGLSITVVVPVTAWAAGAAPAWRPLWWSGWAALVLDLLILDGLIYWWHRANHRAPFLWRFHSVHHLDRTLDSTTALRFHFGEVALSAGARAVVVLALAIPLASVLAFETLLLIATIFHHSNLRLPPSLERALARLVVTPSIHWVHHHRIRRDTDSNYSTVLSIWDPLFRSRSRTRRTPDLEIGVEGREEEPVLGLVVAPFKP